MLMEWSEDARACPESERKRLAEDFLTAAAREEGNLRDRSGDH